MTQAYLKKYSLVIFVIFYTACSSVGKKTNQLSRVPSHEISISKLEVSPNKETLEIWQDNFFQTEDFLVMRDHEQFFDNLLLKGFHPKHINILKENLTCLLYTSPSPRDQRGSRMPSSA